jgi:two-component system phosphate regulon sensor histidine kinase PhoR
MKRPWIRFCKEAAAKTSTRVTVILPDGRVVGDSEEIPANMDNHRDRDEVRDAYRGETGMSIRHSDTISRNMMYVAFPLYADETLVGVLRTSLAVTAIDERIGGIRWRIGVGAMLVALLASGISWFVSRRITQPLEKMRSSARRFAEGDLSHRMALSDIREFSGLAETMNQMAEQLQQRMDEITSQRKTEAGAVQHARRGYRHGHGAAVISINPTRFQMFDMPMETVFGRSILEVIRNHEFQELMDRSLSTGESVESDIVYHQNGERTFNVHCTPLLDSHQKRMGGLVVISDVTQLRRLENMRRDFAASVSHEIKTPLTAIKGFVETLVTGELDDREETRRFLTIIDKHVNRLAAIIDDLMQLSRIERDLEIQQIGLEICRIEDVLNAAVGLCSEGIREKGIDVHLSCEADLSGRFDATLLEQAAVNLLDNAIKYSPEKSTIHRGAAAGEEIRICFKDRGHGDCPKTPVPAVRAVLSGGQGAQPKTRRHRSGTGHRQAYCPGPRRHRHVRASWKKAARSACTCRLSGDIKSSAPDFFVCQGSHEVGLVVDLSPGCIDENG